MKNRWIGECCLLNLIMLSSIQRPQVICWKSPYNHCKAQSFNQKFFQIGKKIEFQKMYFLSLNKTLTFVNYSGERQVFVPKYLLYCQILDQTRYTNKNQSTRQANNNSKNKVDPWLAIIKSASKRKAWLFLVILRLDNHPNAKVRIWSRDILECLPISRVSKIWCQLSDW